MTKFTDVWVAIPLAMQEGGPGPRVPRGYDCAGGHWRPLSGRSPENGPGPAPSPRENGAGGPARSQLEGFPRRHISRSRRCRTIPIYLLPPTISSTLVPPLTNNGCERSQSLPPVEAGYLRPHPHILQGGLGGPWCVACSAGGAQLNASADLETTSAHIARVAKQGIAPLVGGSMGEAHHMSHSERVELIKQIRRVLGASKHACVLARGGYCAGRRRADEEEREGEESGGGWRESHAKVAFV